MSIFFRIIAACLILADAGRLRVSTTMERKHKSGTVSLSNEPAQDVTQGGESPRVRDSDLDASALSIDTRPPSMIQFIKSPT